MKILIINQANSTNNNALFQYEWPTPVQVKDSQIALTNISLYYSWFNITSISTGGRYNNNFYQYKWIDGNTYPVEIPDGFYDVEALNQHLQSLMVKNQHYMIAPDKSYVYFLQWQENSTYYGVQLNSFPVPTPTQATSLGYTLPVGASWSLPVNKTTTPFLPQVIISSTNNFYKIVGFIPSTYPPSQIAGDNTASFISQNTPQVSPVSSILIMNSLVRNNANPSTLMYAFSPNVQFGSQINLQVQGQLQWCDMSDGTFKQFQVRLTDQFFNDLPLRDTNLVITFAMKNKNELS